MPKIQKHNQIRIIGGSLRGRKIEFLDQPSLRPTPNRVRETLFNWLSPFIVDAYCLDLFSGSGALGIEALSRGAKHVTFVDQNKENIQQLKKQLSLLNLQNFRLCLTTILNCIPEPQEPFNIVFLDPPFHKNLLETTCHWLSQHIWLAPSALIYIEAEADLDTLPIPSDWQLLKHKKAGQVGYHLIQN